MMLDIILIAYTLAVAGGSFWLGYLVGKRPK